MYSNESERADEDSYFDFKLKKIPCKHLNTPRLRQCLYICQVSRQLVENKNDLLKLIKPKWPPQPRSQSHMKTDNT